MGALIEASCKCGHKQGFAVGGGMRNHLTYCNFPCYCDDCGAIFGANLFESDIECSECGSRNFKPYDHISLRILTPDPEPEPLPLRYKQQSFWQKLLRKTPEVIRDFYYPSKNIFDWNTKEKLGRKLALTDEKYFCPKCKNFTMTFHRAGCWD